MIKEKIIKTQPIVYRTLNNALINHKFAHAYLFSGVKGTPKKDTAILFVQSLVCEHTVDSMACEQCDTCRRIAEGTYADMILLDGTKESIKKESILKLQENFSKTALEKGGKKFYILDYAENATPEALNSLLKFLEEPSGHDTHAILIVDSIDRLLPTIVSRCQIIPFIPLKAENYYEEAIAEGMDKTDSYILGYLVKDIDLMRLVSENENYQIGLQVTKQFVEMLDQDLNKFLVWFETEILGSKEKDKDKEIFKYFLEISLLLFRDVVSGKVKDKSWYEEEVERLRKKDYAYEKIILILLEGKDKCSKSYNLQLLIEQTIYQVKEVVRYGRN